MFPDIPIYIMNLPKRKDRYDYMKSFLLSIGIKQSNINFVTGNSDQVLIPFDKNKLVRNKELTLEASKNLNDPYIANAVTQVRYIKKIADSSKMGIIMEDDIINLVNKEKIGFYIQEGLKQLEGKDWDMLFLEYCYENCSKRKEINKNLYKLYSPYCSAAILFSNNGAKKVYKLCSPVFKAIDNMYPSLIEEGKIEAYAIKPTLFGQNEYFGSDANREGEIFLKQHKNRNRECKVCDNKIFYIIFFIIVIGLIFFIYKLM
jgi:GR25 family glycosyltransferase involved in LPS biosynthesis